MKIEVEIPTIEQDIVNRTEVLCNKCEIDMKEYVSQGIDETMWTKYTCPKCGNSISIRDEVTRTIQRVKSE